MGLFDKLSGSLQKVFRDMRGCGKLSEQNIQDALLRLRKPYTCRSVAVQMKQEF